MNPSVKSSANYSPAVLGRLLRSPSVLIVAGLVVATIMACNIGGGEQAGPVPSAAITAPVSGSKFQSGEEVIVQGVATAPQGIIRLELWVNGALTGGMSTPSGEAEQSFAAAMRWVPAEPGQYTLEVRGVNVEQKPVASASVIVTVEQGAAPLPSPTATIVPQPPQPQPGCTPSVTARTNVNVRAGPGTGYTILGTLKQGQSAQVVGRDASNSWWQIKVDGSLAWVSAHYTEANCTEGVPVVTPPGPGPTPTPAVHINFRADRTTIKVGECTAIRWDVDNAKAVYYNDGGGDQGVQGHEARTVCPSSTTTYRLKVVHKDDRTEEKQITINVQGSSGLVINFRVDKAQIKPGECTILRWDVDNAKAVYISDEHRETGVPPHGSAQICPGESTTYVLRATRQDNVDERREVHVAVETGPGTVNFRVDSQHINLGECTIVRWDVDDAQRVYLDLGNGEKRVDSQGSAQVCPAQTSTYNLRVQWHNGSETGHQVTVSVSGPQPPVVHNFSLDKRSVSPGECATLSWQVENASAVYLEGQGVPGQGSQQVCPVSDTTYTLTVQGYDNSQRDYHATLQVQQFPPPTVEFRADPPEVAPTDCTTLLWNVQNGKEIYLDGTPVAPQDARQVCPQSDTTYTLTVVGLDGSRNDYQVTVRILIVIVTPTVNLYADPPEVKAGECSTLHWNVDHGREFYLNGEPVGQSGSRQVCPGETTVYTLRAIELGTMPNEQSVMVSVVQPPQPQPTEPPQPQPTEPPQPQPTEPPQPQPTEPPAPEEPIGPGGEPPGE
jgi:carbon monoxide dehydrogenase subunit G